MACPLVRTALTRQSLRSRPLVRTALDTAKPSLLSARPHGFDPTKPSFSSACSHGFDTAKPSLLSARPHGFDPTKPSFSSARSHGFDTAKPSLSSARPHGFGANLAIAIVRTARGPSKALAFPRPRRSCKVSRSPRNDSLLRTVLPLQQLAHVRPAVRARNQADTPPVNPTYRHNRGCRSTEIDAPARYHAVHVTTRCYGLFYHCNNWLTYDPLYEPETRSTHPQLTTTYRHNQGYRSTNLDRPQMPATIV